MEDLANPPDGAPPVRTATIESFQSNDTEKDLEFNRNQHELAKRELDSILGRFTRTAACGRQFILVDSLIRHLEAPNSAPPVEPGAARPRWWASDFERLWKTSIFRKTGGAPDLDAASLRRSTTLFFILLQLDCAELTPEFLHNKLDDSKLPLAEGSFTRTIREQIDRHLHLQQTDSTRAPKSWSQFLAEFLEKQIAWCPVKLEIDLQWRDVGTQVLPFYVKVPVSAWHKNPKPSSHGSSIYMIEVPAGCVGQHLARQFEGLHHEVRTKSTEPEDIREGKTEPVSLTTSNHRRRADGEMEVYRFALKEFPPEKRQAFEKERMALKALNRLGGLVTYIGWYQYVDEATVDSTTAGPSHCILLELGNNDLDEQMTEEAAPDLPSEIKVFWEELRRIADALVAIHKFSIDGTEYHGYVLPFPATGHLVYAQAGPHLTAYAQVARRYQA
jgi:hypothetical protein